MFLLSGLYNYMEKNAFPNYYDETKFFNVPYKIQISNLGSSHGVYGFDYRNHTKDYTTFNFALTSQSLSYDYLILKQYEDHLADNGIMFIVISNFSFGYDEESDPDFKSKNLRYYRFLKPEYIKQFDWKQYYFEPFFIGTKEVLTLIKQKIITAFKTDKNQNDDLYEMGGIDFDYKKNAEEAYKRHLHVDKKGKLIIIQKEIDALYGIINICKNHNITPVLVTTPYRIEYNSKYNDEFYKQLHDVISSICKKAGVEYHDYRNNPRFETSYKFNRNADHLTPLGAVVFTDTLFKEFIEQK